MSATSRPILFSGPMVRAHAAGRKTQTKIYAPPGMSPLDPEHLARRVMNGISHIDDRGCWIWGRSVSMGYGSMTISRKTVRVHRVALAIWLDVAESSLDEVCHRCDNSMCCNPEHLFDGTHAENVKDAIEKGRARAPIAPRLFGLANPAARLAPEAVAEIRKQSNEPQRVTALRFGISQSMVSSIRLRKVRRHG